MKCPTALKILKELNRAERTCTIFNAFGNPQKKAEVKKALTELQQAINNYDKLSKQPRCPCGGELEGLGWDIATKDEVWQCKKCNAQIVIQQALKEAEKE